MAISKSTEMLVIFLCILAPFCSEIDFQGLHRAHPYFSLFRCACISSPRLVTQSVTQSQRWIFTNLTILSVAISQTNLRCISTISQPYLSHISAISQPNLSHISTIYQPYFSHFSAISQQYLSHISAISQPYLNHISIIY